MTTPDRVAKLGRFTAMGGLGLLGALALSAAAGVGAGAVAAQPVETAPHAAATTAVLDVAEGDVARYEQHVLTLSNPYFEGRRPGSRGNERAAEYLEFWFKDLGLWPLFPQTITSADGTEVINPGASYRQSFPYGRDVVVEEQSVRVTPKGGEARTLSPGQDYTVLGISGSGTASGEVVFAGYAIDEASSGFTSFPPGSADSLEGKVAMILRFEPVNADGKSEFTGNTWSNAAAIGAKLRAVAERGASAIILTSPPGADDPRIDVLETTSATARIARALEIPVVMLSMDAADALVRAADPASSLMTLRKAADKGEKLIPLAGASVEVTTKLGRPQRTTDNIAGVLPGKGALADQYVIVGAHFDHVGDGSLGGSRSNEAGMIHYGADDNASGTAGLLLAAEQMSREYAELPEGAEARSVIFMGFSAEEIGLVGSRYFVHNSPIEASATYAMVNMDMIGRLRDGKLEAHGTGTAEGFEEFLAPMFESSGMTVGNSKGGRGPSDHASFYAVGVPVLHFFTGYHDEYHTPRDVSSLINSEGGARVATLATQVATALAMRTEPLVFSSTERRAEAGADPHAGPQAQAQAGSGMGGVQVRFGISPGSYSDTEAGVLVGEVFPDTSAAEAGIVRGDRLLKWNGQEIGDVEGWMVFLRKAKAGDEVEVTVKRGAEELPLKVKLRGRDQGAR